MAYREGPKQKLTETKDMCFSQSEKQEKELPIALLRRQNTGFCAIASCIVIKNTVLSQNKSEDRQ